MTGIEVAQNALMNINSYKYLYGAKGEVATSAQIESLITAYPSHFNTDSRKSAARAKAGYRCIDCSGYVCLSMGMRSIGSWQLYETAAQKLTMHFSNNKWMAGGTYIPYGAVLWKPGHVGIYVGNQQSAEAVSEESDLQINNIDGRGFTHALLFDEGAVIIDYAANLNDAALSVPASLVQPGYIPWIGKIINAEEVVPKIAPDNVAPNTYFGALHNGEQIRVTGLYGDYYHIEKDNGLRGYINSYYIGNLNAPAYESGYISWTGQVSGADNHVNVRTAPRVTAALHGTFPELPNGTSVRVTGETLGTEDLRLWYQVTLSDNSTAFIRADLVSPFVISTYAAWTGKAQSTTGIVNIRSAASVNSSLSQLHAALSNGDSVTVTGETMGSDGYRWYSVSIDGAAVGYCRSDLIVPAYEDYYEEWYAIIQTGTGSGNLRVGPGTNYNTVTGSPFTNGTLVHIEGEAEGTDGYVWYQLTELSGYRRGYIRADLVQAASNYPNWTVYAETVTGTLNIRSGPGTGFVLSDVVSSVSNGKELTVISQTLGTDLKIWYQVKVDGVTAGYVRSDLVIAARPKAYAEWTATAASNTGVVNIRSGPSTNTAVINGYSQMNNGDQCTVYGQVEGPDDGRIWYKVKVMNTWFGYVRADLLSHGTTVTLTHGYAKWNGKLQGATQNVNIRTDAGTGYDIAATLPNGTNVEVIGTKNGTDNYVWYQVRTSGAAGYVRSDLVVHAGNTIGDNPYTVVSWQGRIVTNQAVNVYDYPMATEEASYPVPMGTYFLISDKVFDSNGGIWYHGTAEDGVTDQNNSTISGYISENNVKVFPLSTECDESLLHFYAHDFFPLRKASYVECLECGKHVKYEKPLKGYGNTEKYNRSQTVTGYSNYLTIQNRKPVLELDTFISILYDMETAFADYVSFSDLYTNQMRNSATICAICGYIMRDTYGDGIWSHALPSVYHIYDYEYHVMNYYPDLYQEIEAFISKENSNACVEIDNSHGYFDLQHMIATTMGYYCDNMIPNYWFGWGLDLITLAHNIHQEISSQSLDCNEELQKAFRMMGKSAISGSTEASSFPFEDYISDVDAIGIAKLLSAREKEQYDIHILSAAVEDYFSSHLLERKINLLTDINETNIGTSAEEIRTHVRADETMVINVEELTALSLAEGLLSFLASSIGLVVIPGEATWISLSILHNIVFDDYDMDLACIAFANYVATETIDMTI